jgi:hypothetical protein
VSGYNTQRTEFIMSKQNDEFKEEQELLLQKDKEMYFLAAKVTDYLKADNPFWIDVWEKFYKWDRTKIRFRDPSELKTSKTDKLMPLISGHSYWTNKTDPEFIAFRKILDDHYPEDPGDNVAMHIWMEVEFYKWTYKLYRLFNIVPPVVKSTVSIPKNICDLYSETRESYISGNFRASIVLSRAVIECCIKDKWSKLYDREWSIGKALSNLLRIGNISQELYSIGDDINFRANKILHQAESANEDDALLLIDETKTFIEKFYK